MATHTWRAETYAENARFVAELGGPLLEMLAPQQGEDILDLGCGDGALVEGVSGYPSCVYGTRELRARDMSGWEGGDDRRWGEGWCGSRFGNASAECFAEAGRVDWALFAVASEDGA